MDIVHTGSIASSPSLLLLKTDVDCFPCSTPAATMAGVCTFLTSTTTRTCKLRFGENGIAHTQKRESKRRRQEVRGQSKQLVAFSFQALILIPGLFQSDSTSSQAETNKF